MRAVLVAHRGEELLVPDGVLQFLDAFERGGKGFFDDEIDAGLGGGQGEGDMGVGGGGNEHGVPGLLEGFLEAGERLGYTVVFGDLAAEFRVEFAHAHRGASGGEVTANVPLADRARACHEYSESLCVHVWFLLSSGPHGGLCALGPRMFRC